MSGVADLAEAWKDNVVFSKAAKSEDNNGAEPSDRSVEFGRNENQQFNSSRHVEAAGINVGKVQQAIRNDLADVDIPQGQTVSRSIIVDGRTTSYNAFGRAREVVNVGRITFGQ